MNLRRGSILVTLIGFMLFLSGQVRVFRLFTLLRSSVIEKENAKRAVRASGTNVQDDFREGAYFMKEAYSDHHLRETLFFSEERLMEEEKRERLFHLGFHFLKDKSDIFLSSPMSDREGRRRKLRFQVIKKERVYFYGANGIYHRKENCRNLKGEKEVFSTMEEAAKKGCLPCAFCVEGRKEGKDGWNRH